MSNFIFYKLYIIINILYNCKCFITLQTCHFMYSIHLNMIIYHQYVISHTLHVWLTIFMQVFQRSGPWGLKQKHRAPYVVSPCSPSSHQKRAAQGGGPGTADVLLIHSSALSNQVHTGSPIAWASLLPAPGICGLCPCPWKAMMAQETTGSWAENQGENTQSVLSGHGPYCTSVPKGFVPGWVKKSRLYMDVSLKMRHLDVHVAFYLLLGISPLAPTPGSALWVSTSRPWTPHCWGPHLGAPPPIQRLCLEETHTDSATHD